MPIALRSTSSVGSTGAGTTGVTISRPAGVQDGDVLYALVGSNSLASTIKWSSSGWTELQSGQNPTQNDRNVQMFRRIVTSVATEPSGYTFTDGNQVGQNLAIILAFSGVDTTAPEDTAAVVSPAGTNSFNPDNVDTTTATGTALVIAGLFLSASITANRIVYGPPADFTLAASFNQPPTGTSVYSGAALAYRLAPPVGAQAIGVWTNTGGAASEENFTFAVALKEAPAVPVQATVAAVEVDVTYAPVEGTTHAATASFSQTATCAADATIVTTVASQVAAVELEFFYLYEATTAVVLTAAAGLSATGSTATALAVEVAAVEVDVSYTQSATKEAAAVLTGSSGLSVAGAYIVGTQQASAAIGPNRVGLSTSDGQELFTDTGSPVEVTGLSPFTFSAAANFGPGLVSASLTATPTCNATARMVNAASAFLFAASTGNAVASQRWGVTASMSATATGVADANLLPATGTLYPATASLSTTATCSAAATQIVAVTHVASASFSQTATCAADASIVPGVVHAATASFSQATTVPDVVASILLAGTVLDAAGSFTVTSTLAADATLETDIPEPLQASASLVATSTGSAAAEAVYLGPTIHYASASAAPVPVLTSPTATMTMVTTAAAVTVPLLYARAIGVEPPGATYAVVTITAATCPIVLSAANAGIQNTPTNARS